MLAISDLQNLLNSPSRTQDNSGELGQAEYFKLMIAQLQNQDPTKPQDGAEYLTQIAQFGTVNGIQELKDSMDLLAGSLSSNQALSAATLIDRQVSFLSDTGYFGGEEEPLTGQVELPQATSQLTLRITDETGATVRTLFMGAQGAGATNFEWDGMDASGNAMPPGRYQVTAEALYGNDVTAVPTLIAGRVESVAFGGFGGPTTVSIAGLGQLSLANVFSIN